MATLLANSEWVFRFYIPYIEFRNADGEPIGNGLVLLVGLAIAVATVLMWDRFRGNEREGR